LRDKNGAEITTVTKSIDPVWCVAFCPQKFDTNDNLLIAGSWDQKLSLYSVVGGKNIK
jgi:WD40 repeat protein